MPHLHRVLFVGVFYVDATPAASVDLGLVEVPTDWLVESVLASRGMWPVTPWEVQADGCKVAKVGDSRN